MEKKQTLQQVVNHSKNFSNQIVPLMTQRKGVFYLIKQNFVLLFDLRLKKCLYKMSTSNVLVHYHCTYQTDSPSKVFQEHLLVT